MRNARTGEDSLRYSLLLIVFWPAILSLDVLPLLCLLAGEPASSRHYRQTNKAS